MAFWKNKFSLIVMLMASTFVITRYVLLKDIHEITITHIDRKSLIVSISGKNQTPIREETLESNVRTDMFLHSTLHFSATCSKFTNVAFLKVHKAGSTTGQNIFLRFAQNNNLNVALSKITTGGTYHYLGYNRSIDVSRLVPILKGEQYNILCSHVVYNKAVFKQVMPSDTIYIGIVREPVSHFFSSGTYYNFFNNLPKNKMTKQNVILDFIRHPAKYPHVDTYWIHNRMASDFGLLPMNFNNVSSIDNLIRELDVDFKLVMIMERFEESLVLLKRYLCWNLKDILFVERNIHKNNKPLDFLTNDSRSWLQKYNMADFMLYQHFKETFSNLVDQEGVQFQKEVEHFKSINTRTKQFCESRVKRSLEISKSDWNEKFSVTPADCGFMLFDEIAFLSHMKTLAFNKIKQ